MFVRVFYGDEIGWERESKIMTIRRALFAFVASLCALIVVAASSHAAEPDKSRSLSGKILWLSDIHFDPFYGDSQDRDEVRAMLKALVDSSDPQKPIWRVHQQWHNIFTRRISGDIQFPLQAETYSPPGNDTNDKLLQTALQRARHTCADPDFIIITGDFLGHSFGIRYYSLAPSGMQTATHYNRFVAQTIAYIAMSVADRFEGVPVYATLGNNDAYCGDYDIRLDTKQSRFLADTAATFKQYFLSSLSADDQRAFEATFLKGGYYTISPRRAKKHRIVVLNSIALMEKYPDADRGDSYPPTVKLCDSEPAVSASGQLAWLADELNMTDRTGRVWVACHVPPGANCYSNRYRRAHQPWPSMYWKDDNFNKFKNLLLTDGHLKNLAGILAGHSHNAEFKLMRDGTNRPVSFVLMCPSISPVHKNNPSFRVMSYDRGSLGISGYQTHYLDLWAAQQDQPTGSAALSNATWKSFSFGESYGAKSVSASSLSAVYDAMAIGANGPSKLLIEYAQNYNTRAGYTSVVAFWNKAYRPGIGNLTGSLYQP